MAGRSWQYSLLANFPNKEMSSSSKHPAVLQGGKSHLALGKNLSLLALFNKIFQISSGKCQLNTLCEVYKPGWRIFICLFLKGSKIDLGLFKPVFRTSVAKVAVLSKACGFCFVPRCGLLWSPDGPGLYCCWLWYYRGPEVLFYFW